MRVRLVGYLPSCHRSSGLSIESHSQQKYINLSIDIFFIRSAIGPIYIYVFLKFVYKVIVASGD